MTSSDQQTMYHQKLMMVMSNLAEQLLSGLNTTCVSSIYPCQYIFLYF